MHYDYKLRNIYFICKNDSHLAAANTLIMWQKLQTKLADYLTTSSLPTGVPDKSASDSACRHFWLLLSHGVTGFHLQCSITCFLVSWSSCVLFMEFRISKIYNTYLHVIYVIMYYLCICKISVTHVHMEILVKLTLQIKWH